MAYEQTCTDNDRVVEGQVIDLCQCSSLTIDLEGRIKLTLKFDARRNHYRGLMSDCEFVTKGPKETRKPNRRRYLIQNNRTVWRVAHKGQRLRPF